MPSRSGTVFLLAATLATAACDKQSPAPEQANVAATAPATPDEVAPDEVVSSSKAAAPASGAVDRTHKGEAAPALAFVDPAGKKVTLADFRGRPVLLNLWATWCAPCIKEMPSLDAAAAGAEDRVRVLAVSQDMQREKVAPFFAQRKLTHLAPYTDADMGLSLHYRVNLPTTIMFDAAGRELWRVSGALDWNGAAAKALIAEATA
ncbi:TlpA disulfide reductase family protein [Sphingomonas sp. TZW2008]|uniref:TlpA family protein disulfide reductase n=1 Tax=Sphingomonas sp. TZW2008 TaxID=1917973 RepID=UPI000A26DF43|nr:TlpA disulfide reductase family protein [Sphingomonas sp. TZW2008]